MVKRKVFSFKRKGPNINDPRVDMRLAEERRRKILVAKAKIAASQKGERARCLLNKSYYIIYI